MDLNHRFGFVRDIASAGARTCDALPHESPQVVGRPTLALSSSASATRFGFPPADLERDAIHIVAGDEMLRGKTGWLWQVDRTVLTYSVLWRVVHSLLPTPPDEPSFERCLALGVLCAFTFEAYLNHVGAQLLSSWPSIERRLGPREKLEVIEELLKFETDRSRLPFQALGEILAFRDAVAHGKTTTLQAKGTEYPLPGEEDEDRSRGPGPLTPWEKMCKPATIRRWIASVEGMVTALHSHTTELERPFEIQMSSVVGPVQPPQQTAAPKRRKRP